MPSESSSADKDCATCGHWRDSHDQGGSHCRVCHTINSADRSCIHSFAPEGAEPPGSASSSPDECQHEEAVQIAGDRLRRPGRRIAYLCNECGEAWTITTPIEAECRSIRTRGEHCFEHGPYCCNCGHPAEPDAAQEAAMQELTDLRQEMEAEPPRRPPYAVAYAVAGGAQYEIALRAMPLSASRTEC
jgi:hypothetical protein